MPKYSGQGKVFIAERDGTGNPLAFRFLGNCSALEVGLATETEEHNESTTGDRLIDLRLEKSKSASMQITMDEYSKENIALALRGSLSTIGASTVTNEAGPNPLAVGDFWRLAKARVSSVVVKDSAGTPATLVSGTHYRVSSADHGMIEILNLAAYTQPFKSDYSHAAVQNIAMFGAALTNKWLRFEGLNTADSKKPVLVELYKVSIDPVTALALINDEVWNMQLPGAPLYDDTKVADVALGVFGRSALLY